MAVPISFERSGLPSSLRRYGHVAVTWKNATIIWGGFIIEEPNSDTRSTIYYHLSGEWLGQETTGVLPDSSHYCQGHVINDTMYVVRSYAMYMLDLNAWTWTSIVTPGAMPIIIDMSTWTHGENIYCYGSTGGGNKLYCFNCGSNSWQVLDQKGEIPSPRSRHLAIARNKEVFLFGGNGEGPEEVMFNDLHVLDMRAMRWRKVHGNSSARDVPSRKSKSSICQYSQSLTRISESAAVLYDSEECWILKLDSAKNLRNPWKRIQSNSMRYEHRAVLEPVSQRLWIIGGLGRPDMLKMEFKLSLKELAIDCAARSICPLDPRMSSEELPRQLRNDIDARIAEVGEEYLLGQHKRCQFCLPSAEPTNKRQRIIHDERIQYLSP